MQSISSVAGRIMIATIFLMSAVGNKIPNFNGVANYMASEGVPMPQLMLVGGIVFLVFGSLSVGRGIQDQDRGWFIACLPSPGNLLLSRLLELRRRCAATADDSIHEESVVDGIDGISDG